jgi:CubicO group peptidase (beta-lactamase class C family)
VIYFFPALAVFFTTLVHAFSPAQHSTSLEQIRRHYRVPGLGVAYFKGSAEGGFSFVEVTGKRKSGHKAGLKPEDAFHLGSCTKSMTALLIALAVNEGKLRYQSTLGEFLSSVPMDPSLKAVSIAHLLVHTSGIGGDSVLDEGLDQTVLQDVLADQIEERQARELLVREILQVPVRTLPGLKFEYSNLGFILLGHLLEKVYDRSFSDLMKEKLFSPLGMSSCGFGVAPRVAGHEHVANGYVPRMEDNPRVYGPAGGVHCSLQDWMKYAAFQIDLYQERSGFLAPVIVKGLFQAVNPDGHTLGGWVTADSEGSRVLVFEGSNTLNYAAILIYPERELALAATSNAGGNQAREATLEGIRFVREAARKRE